MTANRFARIAFVFALFVIVLGVSMRKTPSTGSKDQCWEAAREALDASSTLSCGSRRSGSRPVRGCKSVSDPCSASRSRRSSGTTPSPPGLASHRSPPSPAATSPTGARVIVRQVVRALIRYQNGN